VGDIQDTKLAASLARLRTHLTWAVFGLLIVLVLGLFWMDSQTRSSLSEDLRTALGDGKSVQNNACYLYLRVALAMQQSGTGLRYFAIAIGGLMITLGTLLTLVGVEAGYLLNATHEKAKMVLETSSPGLVMATLGVVAILFALLRSQSLTASDTACLESSSKQVQSEGVAPKPPAAPGWNETLELLEGANKTLAGTPEEADKQ
jgi:hypothetical protein